MKTSKISRYNGPGNTDPNNWARDVNSDLDTIFLCLSGRIRFGPNNTNINKGENILGQFVTYTSNSSANTEDAISHNLSSIPIGYIVVRISKGGVIYDSGTTWTSSKLFLKCSTTSTLVTLFLLQ